MNVTKSARAKINYIVSKGKVTAALAKILPSAADRSYKANYAVLIYDEQSQRWKVVYIVLDRKYRLVTVTDEDRVSKICFNAFQLRTYLRLPNESPYRFQPSCKPPLDTIITKTIEPCDSRFGRFGNPI